MLRHVKHKVESPAQSVTILIMPTANAKPVSYLATKPPTITALPSSNPASQQSKIQKKFQTIADRVSKIVGSPVWFIFSIFMVLVWIPSGFLLGWGEMWHLLINTSTTILTFLMMSLLHSSQSRWESKIEKLQYKQDSDLKAIKEMITDLQKPRENGSSITSLRV